MAAGYVTLNAKDSDGTVRKVRFLSDSGLGSGNLTPVRNAVGDDGLTLHGSKGDAVWDGAIATPTWTALFKYIGTKLEALRALIAAQPTSIFSYQVVAANQNPAPLGAAGALGDILSRLIITPLTHDPGTVQIKDGNGAALTVFQGGNLSSPNFEPISITLGMKSLVGGWSLITGANISVIVVGQFTQS